MIATLRRGRSLRLHRAGVTLHRDEPQQLTRVTDYVYAAAAHKQRLELEPTPVMMAMQREGQHRRVAPWQVGDMKRSGWKIQPLEKALRPGAQVLVIRNMGLGDVLMLTPALRALHEQRRVRVQLATYACYLPLLWGLDWIEATYALGTDYHVERFDAVVDLNWAVESGKQVEQRPRQDIFAERLGVSLRQRCPFYQVARSERQWAQRQLVPWRRPIVGIQLHASCAQRSYPARHILRLTELLQAKGCTVAFYGERWSEKLPSGVIDLIGAASLRQAAALIEQMAAMVCPDSGLLHLAVAVGTPTVGLFGPIPPELRTVGYPQCTTVSVPGACPDQPCFDAGASSCRRCRCMGAIKPEAVVAAAQMLVAERAQRP